MSVRDTEKRPAHTEPVARAETAAPTASNDTSAPRAHQGSTPAARAILGALGGRDPMPFYERYKAKTFAAARAATEQTASREPVAATIGGEQVARKAGAKAAPKKAASTAGREAPANEVEHGETTRLPPEIQAQFPDADLSAVTVVLDSQQARRRDVQGFAHDNVIHVARGVDRLTVLRHEATHIAQQLKGKLGGGGGGTVDSLDALESQATHAEEGRHLRLADTSVASPTSTLNSGNDKGSGKKKPDWNSEHKGHDELPKVSFNVGEKGITLDKISGSTSGDILNADWEETDIAKGETFFPFPGCPIAGLTVKAGVTFKPTAKLSSTINYEWNAGNKRFTVGGAVTGLISGELAGFVQGGTELNALVQEVGVGVRGRVAATAEGKIEGAFKLQVGKDATVTVDSASITAALGGDIKATISALMYSEGWFGDKIAEWTFAEFNLAHLVDTHAEFGVDSTSVAPELKKITPGTLGWGSPPSATPANARPLARTGLSAHATRIRLEVEEATARQMKERYAAAEASPEDLMCVMPEEDARDFMSMPAEEVPSYYDDQEMCRK